MALDDHGRIYIFTFVFACVVGKNMKAPSLSPKANDTITRGSVRGMGSPFHAYLQHFLLEKI